LGVFYAAACTLEDQTPSEFLMEVEAPIIEVSLCKYLYSTARNIPSIKEQICADHPTGTKDICNVRKHYLLENQSLIKTYKGNSAVLTDL